MAIRKGPYRELVPLDVLQNIDKDATLGGFWLCYVVDNDLATVSVSHRILAE